MSFIFPSPSCRLPPSLTHLILLSLDLEAPFVLLICFSPVSSARCSGQPCLPDVGLSSPALSWQWACERGLRQSCRPSCCADLKGHSLDGHHLSLFSYLCIFVIPVSWTICCSSPYHHHHHSLHCLSCSPEIWAMGLFTGIIQTGDQSNMPN